MMRAAVWRTIGLPQGTASKNIALATNTTAYGQVFGSNLTNVVAGEVCAIGPF